METPQKIPTVVQVHKRMLELSGKDPRGLTPRESMPSNCYAAACALVDLLGNGARAAYGMWSGQDVRHPDRDFHRHGWVVHDGRILDPTRWVFEGKDPYIWKGAESSRDYDEGMERLKQAICGDRPPPARDPKEMKFLAHWTLETESLLKDLFEDDRDLCWMYLGELFWLANLTPKVMRPHIREIYDYLKEIGQSVLIPIDYRNLVAHWIKEGEI